MSKVWYHLDPDNRKDDPKSGLFCARCKKKVKNNILIGYTSIVLHEEHPWFRKATGFDSAPLYLRALIGNDCLETVIKKFGEADDAITLLVGIQIK